jgi:hypothetical protein
MAKGLRFIKSANIAQERVGLPFVFGLIGLDIRRVPAYRLAFSFSLTVALGIGKLSEAECMKLGWTSGQDTDCTSVSKAGR